MNSAALTAEAFERAEHRRSGHHPDLLHGYGFEDGAGRVPITDVGSVTNEVDRLARERLGIVETLSPEQQLREFKIDFTRELLDAVALGVIQRQFWTKRGKKRAARQTIGTRFLIFCWLCDPSSVSPNGNPISLSALARQMGCKVSNLSSFAAELSRALNLRNYFQYHDSMTGRVAPEPNETVEAEDDVESKEGSE